MTIIYPMLALVTLTFLSWAHLYVVRLGLMFKHKIDPEDMTPFNRNLPKGIVTSGDNFRNLCELPTLFYPLCLLVMVLDIQADSVVYMAWAFVGLRVIHSLIHCTYNRIKHRFIVYFIGAVVLWALWAHVAILAFGQAR